MSVLPQAFRDLGEQIARCPPLPTLQRSQPFTNCFYRLQTIRQIEQPLIGLGVLDDDFGLAVDRQHQWLPCFLELAEEFVGVPFEIRQRVNISRQIYVIPIRSPCQSMGFDATQSAGFEQAWECNHPIGCLTSAQVGFHKARDRF
jgi:hypothetical protein